MSGQAQGPFVRISSSARLGLNPEVCQLDLAQRVAALSAPARTFHRAVLRAFLGSGHAPTLAELRPMARLIGVGLERVLAELVVHDVIQRVADSTLITIAIELTSAVHRWFPATAVVLANECPEEPVIKAECACPFINAFASPETAERWRAKHPELGVHLLTQEQALAEVRTIFGPLLEETPGIG